MRGAAIVILCAAAAPAGARTLDAPQLTIKPQGALAAFTSETVDVLVGWRPVAGAASYRVTIGDATTETKDLRFERKGLPIGKYSLTVVAVDRDGNASPPSESLPLNVIEIRAVPPGATVSMPPQRNAYAIGTRFSVAGMHCELSDAPVDDLLVGPENEIRIPVAGLATLRCAGIPGYLERQVVIAPVTVATTSHAIRGVASPIDITLASVAYLGPDLRVDSRDDIALGEAQRTPSGFRVPVTARGPASLSIKSGDFELGRVEVAVDTASAPPPPPPYEPIDWRALDLGGHAGAFFPPKGPRASTIGHPETDDKTVGPGPLVGLRVGFFPIPRVGLEGEFSLIEAGLADESGSRHLFATRGSLAVRAIETSRVGVRMLVGAGAVTASSATEMAGHLGAALTIETSPNLWLRFQFLDVVTTARDNGYAHCLELQLGLMTRIGRRDRWE
jgi:hypothetical protein